MTSNREPTADELRRVARWLASVGYYSAAGVLHKRAWQLGRASCRERVSKQV